MLSCLKACGEARARTLLRQKKSNRPDTNRSCQPTRSFLTPSCPLRASHTHTNTGPHTRTHRSHGRRRRRRGKADAILRVLHSIRGKQAHLLPFFLLISRPPCLPVPHTHHPRPCPTSPSPLSSQTSAFLNLPLWKASAIGQSGFQLASTTSLHPSLPPSRPSYLTRYLAAMARLTRASLPPGQGCAGACHDLLWVGEGEGAWGSTMESRGLGRVRKGGREGGREGWRVGMGLFEVHEQTETQSSRKAL